MDWRSAVVTCVLLICIFFGDFRSRRKERDETDISPLLEKAGEAAAKLRRRDAAGIHKPTPEERSWFEQVAEIAPRAAILEAGLDIEDTVRSLALAMTVGKQLSGQSMLDISRFLRSQNWIDETMSSVLYDLRVLRIYAQADQAEFTTEDALKYRSIADVLIARLHEIANDRKARGDTGETQMQT